MQLRPLRVMNQAPATVRHRVTNERACRHPDPRRNPLAESNPRSCAARSTRRLRPRAGSHTANQAVTTFANTGPCMNRTSCWRSSSHCVSSTTPSKISGIRTRCAYATSAFTIPSRSAMPASILI